MDLEARALGESHGQPVDADVTVVLRSPQEPPIPPAETHRLDALVELAQTAQPVPDPIQLRGVGSTTLWALE